MVQGRRPLPLAKAHEYRKAGAGRVETTGLCDMKEPLVHRSAWRRIGRETVVRRWEGDIARRWGGARGRSHGGRSTTVTVSVKAHAIGGLASVSDQLRLDDPRGEGGSGHGGGIVVLTVLGKGGDE